MIKVFGMLHKRSDITQEQFHAHWAGPHAVEALKLTAVMKRYVQNHKAAEPFPGFEPPCDGSPECWMDDLDSAGQLNAVPEYLTGAYPDEPRFMRERSAGIMVTEQVEIEGPPIAKDDELVKVLAFYRRDPELSHQAFVEQWLAHKTPLITGGSELARWVRSPAAAEAYVDSDPMFDGAEELWWSDKDAYAKDADGGMARSDLAHLLDLDATKVMFVDENRVHWPGGI
ncbi:MAG: EthD domain-containing protein [Alphaproteobacteria bacterium]